MIKSILLASTMIIAAPVFAQTAAPTPPATQSTPMTQSDPTTTAPTDATSQPATPASPDTAAQSTDAQTTPGDTNTGMTAQADPQAATPAAPSTDSAQADTSGTSTQTADATAPADQADAVKAVVDQEWASYDANTDGKLDAAEFGKWMVALKTKADPSTKASDPATKTWVSGAFASADTDKSKSVSKAELTGYLSKG